ncbi:hypothetical protein ISF_01069 [Cordyceps fumosorosea ARSEF 2679]|uniref:Uncharacterized protein n=1 Tax=Cordyceps fumosorosea (strain ARSEF 2679) TaxID=1081104 RepID=A0A162KFD4_CORFA|nr:hypothetical protein ISF_01069 [Cordyceps fumosorosea ARSEF 2679]OAA74168.1 hypothetical protein ISF_01069 [Cordyceps fumosorosea ARSEF 2679]
MAKRSTLAKKTSGFLAAVTPSQKRVVVAWAQSGHGISGRGDTLIPGDHVLGNAQWASKAIHLAKILDYDLASPFDKPGTPPGCFQAAHVELKLATYAVTLLLRRLPGRPRGNDILARENLVQLRKCRWSNDHRHRPHLEGTRVVPIEYHKQQLLAAEELGRAGGDAKKQRPTTKLQTYEEDGVIHYVQPAPANTSQERLSSQRRRRSPHELSDVEKPLPATAVTEDPYTRSPTPERPETWKATRYKI